MSQKLPDPKRYITHNNEKDGMSEFSQSLPETLPTHQDLGGAFTRLAYNIPCTPAVLTNAADLKAYEKDLKDLPPLVKPNGGTNVWYIDTPPGAESPMHRTESLDFIIQIQGEIELTQANGETRLVKPGDITIQRSTMHKWRNPSSINWSRMVGVLVSCEPVKLTDGKVLGTEFL